MTSDKVENVYDIINRFKISKNNTLEHTHVSISNPKSKYYIPNDKDESKKFMIMYKKAFLQGIPLSLCEKHIDISPILIDLDFHKLLSKVKKYDKTDDLIPESKSFTEHIYHINFIESFINYYIKELIEYLDISNITYIDIYVMEKQRAIKTVTHKIDNGQKEITTKVKDGVHIIIPDVVTCPEVQYIIRNNFIKKYSNFFKKLALSNKIEDIFDESVIKRNNWLMYGSSKRTDDYDQIYYVSNIYKFDINKNKLCKFVDGTLANIKYGKKFEPKSRVTNNSEDTVSVSSSGESNYEANDINIDNSELDENSISDNEKYKELSFRKKHVHYIDLFSIRNKFKEITYNQNKVEEIKEYIRKINEKNFIKDSKPKISEHEQIENPDLEYIRNLVKLLSPERADSYLTWLDVCWCLRNIDHRTYNDFLDFSRKSSKFDEASCFKQWSAPKKDGFGIGSLIHWAKTDNMKAYQQVISKKIFDNDNDIADDDNSIAKLTYKYLGPRFMVYQSDNGKVKWFEFRNHRWHSDNNSASLHSILSDEMTEIYKSYGTKYYQDDNHAQADLCKKIMKMLKNVPPKTRIVKELGNIYSKTQNDAEIGNKCIFKFDTNTTLLGFNNGVFDFNSETFGFRDGRPEDNITYTTGYNYRHIPFDEYEYENNDHNHEYDEDQQIISDIMLFFEQVFPNKDVRDYMLMSFAECLTG